MGKDELIDSHVSLKQCKQAVNALHSHSTKQYKQTEATELLPPKDQHVWLNVTVRKIPSVSGLKVIKVPIKHPLIDPRTTPICLITKDPQRHYKDLLTTQNIKFISKIVGINKLKGKFKPYEARRCLLKENGMFLADERVLPMLPKLLGKKWFDAKKQPIPVNLTRKDLKSELERAISSTYMHQNQGTCTSIKIGVLPKHSPVQVLENLMECIPGVVNGLSGQGGWENVQALHLKTSESVALPVWTCGLGSGEGGRWFGLEQGDGTMEGVQEEEDQEDEEEDEKPKKKKQKIQNEVQDQSKAAAATATATAPSDNKKTRKTSASPSKITVPSPPVPETPPTPTTTTTNKKRKKSTTSSDSTSLPLPPPPPPTPETTKPTKSKPSTPSKGSSTASKSKKSTKADDAPEPEPEKRVSFSAFLKPASTTTATTTTTVAGVGIKSILKAGGGVAGGDSKQKHGKEEKKKMLQRPNDKKKDKIVGGGGGGSGNKKDGRKLNSGKKDVLGKRKVRI